MGEHSFATATVSSSSGGRQGDNPPSVGCQGLREIAKARTDASFRALALMFHKNPEEESVRDEQQRYNESRNEVGGAQLARHEPGMIGLIERIQDVG